MILLNSHFIVLNQKKKINKLEKSRILYHILRNQSNFKDIYLVKGVKQTSINLTVFSFKNLKNYLNLLKKNLKVNYQRFYTVDL